MPDTPNPEPRWPVHFLESCQVLSSSHEPVLLERARGNLWLILNSAVFRSASYHASRYGGVPREELEDIAAQKSLDLLNRIQAGGLDLSDRPPKQLISFISSVAENGLMDLFRAHGRTTSLSTDDPPAEAADSTPQTHKTPGPEDMVESRAYATALRDCAANLETRARTVWIFRVFYEMSSKEISSHPELRIKPGYVDVILQRVRETMRKCMRKKGLDTHRMPTGTLVEMWRAFRLAETSTTARA